MKKIIFLWAVLFYFLPLYAQVGINTNIPDNSAALDISSNNKGILIPRVYLIGTTDALSIPSPATSLLLYNTNPTLPSGTGFYFNNGTPSDPLWVNLRPDSFRLPFNDTVETAVDAFSISNVGPGNALKIDGKISITNTGEKMGKILMVTGPTGNVTWEGGCAFSAYSIGNSNLVVQPNTDVKLPFYLEGHDIGNNFITATSIINPSSFIVPRSAIYHFDATIMWNAFSGNSNTDFGALTIWINNYPYLTDRQAAGATAFTNHLSTDISLLANDIVVITAYQNNSSQQTISNMAATNNFSGRFVSLY